MTNLDPIITLDAFLALEGPRLLLDARSRDAYRLGHPDGAVHADLEAQLSTAGAPGFDPAQGGRHPLPPLAQWLQTVAAWGVTPETTVAIYDDQLGAMGAARAWWMLKAIGHARVHLLDGGWPEASRLQTPLPALHPAPLREVDHWLLPLVDADQIEALRQDPAWKVLDVRATERYLGRVEPLDPVAGHIPGVLNLPLAANLDPQGRFRPAEVLRDTYLAFLGGTPPDHLAVHCGSGVSACQTLVALERAGLAGASLYIGSWSEWCRSGRPQAQENA